jgi:hypothetical protein
MPREVPAKTTKQTKPKQRKGAGRGQRTTHRGLVLRLRAPLLELLSIGTHHRRCHYCNVIEAPWLVNSGHGASLRHHIAERERERAREREPFLCSRFGTIKKNGGHRRDRAHGQRSTSRRVDDGRARTSTSILIESASVSSRLMSSRALPCVCVCVCVCV